VQGRLSAETHEATADGFILRGARCHKTKFTNCVPPQSKKKKTKKSYKESTDDDADATT